MEYKKDLSNPARNKNDVSRTKLDFIVRLIGLTWIHLFGF